MMVFLSKGAFGTAKEERVEQNACCHISESNKQQYCYYSGKKPLCFSEPPSYYAAYYWWEQDLDGRGCIVKKCFTVDSDCDETYLQDKVTAPSQAIVHSGKDIFVVITKEGSLLINTPGNNTMEEIATGLTIGKIMFIGDTLWFFNIKGEWWKKDFSVLNSKFECVWKLFT